MQFTKTKLTDIVLIEPKVFEDERGFFFESFKKKSFADAGITTDFVQDNHSRSRKGTLRGLHYQIQQPQGKLVRVTLGEIFDIAVDVRRSSPTFGEWVGYHLSAENKKQLWIPAGFAHGFYVVSEWAEMLYKTTDYYAPQHERAILWNDPAIGIEWPLVNGEAPLLSAKDAAAALLDQAETFE